MFVFKFVGYFFISFIIMSFPIKNRPVFEHLDRFLRPSTEKIYIILKRNAKEGAQIGKDILKKIFNNTSLKEDKLKTKISSIQKKKNIIEEIKKEDKTLDEYTDEEKELLRKVFQKVTE